MPTCHILFPNYLIIKQLFRLIKFITSEVVRPQKIVGPYKSII
jgi:hypothetical protein